MECAAMTSSTSGLKCASRSTHDAAREWEVQLRELEVASPTLVARRDMLSRTESKFVLSVSTALSFLTALTEDYAVLRAGEGRIASYCTLYFDTDDLALFHAHRRGVRLRQKVRIRHYPERNLSFLEVKTRTGDGVTRKLRRPRAYGDNHLSVDDRAFTRSHCPVPTPLMPQVWVDYQRVTLLNTTAVERVTIDFDLGMTRHSSGGHLRDLAVVEVKQADVNRRTAAMRALRTTGARRESVSKYCAAIMLTSPSIRANGLLPGLRALTAVGTWAS